MGPALAECSVCNKKSDNNLFGNMTMILLLGPLLEERHGSSSLLAMIAITALSTGIINVLFLDTFLLGASFLLHKAQKLRT